MNMDKHDKESEPMACCAHRRVIYVRINHQVGTCSDSWECADCKCKFAPTPRATGNAEPQEWWIEKDADGCWHIGEGDHGFVDLGDGNDAESTAKAIRDAHNAAIERAKAIQLQHDGDVEDSWQEDSKASRSGLVANYIRWFAKEIEHGDEKHRKWLRDAANSFIENGTVATRLCPCEEEDIRRRVPLIAGLAAERERV